MKPRDQRLSAVGFHVRTSQTPGDAQESTESGPGSGPSTLASFAYFDPASCSLKTSRLSLFEDLTASSVTLPRSGTMRNGRVFARVTSARRTNEIACLFLPTPTASSAGFSRGGSAGRVGPVRPSLGMMARFQLLPTPMASQGGRGGINVDAANRQGGPSLGHLGRLGLLPTPVASARANRTQRAPPSAKNGRGRHLSVCVFEAFPTPTVSGNYNRKGSSPTSGDGLATKVGGRLSPRFLEWMMGLPIDWTARKP